MPGIAPAAETPAIAQKTESFDHDPGWEAVNNRIAATITTAGDVTQTFGWSSTNVAT